MKKIALLIGIGRYPASDLSPLPAAPEDARALSAVLANPELGGFTEDGITLLTDPGRGEMELAIERLFSGRDRDDLALLYFSGHGIKDDTGALYLAAFDTCKSPNGELLRASAVSAAMVLDNMARSRSRRQVVILDSCYSGAFPVGFTGKDDGRIDIPTQLLPRAAGASPGRSSGDPANGQGRAILTASTAIGQAFQQDNEGLSLYTRFLIRGIETGEADASDNGFITVDELHGYARRRIEAVRPAMEPAIYVVGGGGDIRIAQVPVGDPRERYRKEVSESLDERGEFLIAARPRLADWRVRLGLDKADYAAIEAELGTKRRGEFDEKCRQYDRLLREILQKRGSLAAEATHLADYRKRLGLPEEEARGREEKAEEAFAAERDRHERNLEIYQASFRTTLQREGAALADGVLADLARLQETLAISEEEAAAIRERVRREEARPIPKPKSGKWETNTLLGFFGGLFGLVAAIVTIIATVPAFRWWETEAPEPSPTPVVSLADANRAAEPSDTAVGKRRAVPHVIIAQAEPPSQRGAVEGRVSPEGVTRQDSTVGWAKERSDVPIAEAPITKATPEPEMGTAPQASAPTEGASRGAFAHPTPATAPVGAIHESPPQPARMVPIRPEPEPARLIVRSNVADDSVLIDGNPVGPTGPEPHELAPGGYTIRVEKAGYEPFEKEITLAAGKEETVPAVLKPKPARLTVEANIPGALVTIDGNPIGSAGPEPHELAPGRYTIRVEKPGYAPSENRVVLTPGEEERVRARLTVVPVIPEPGQTFRDRLKSGGEGPEMVVIPAGEFLMGSPPDEKGHDEDEGPQRRVSVARFALGATEVTFTEYDRFARATGRRLPSDRGWGRENRPVINVSWKDATAYAEWLSEQTGEGYRLPTEAEWEYAARAGTTTPFSTGECIHTTQANYDGNYDYAGCGAKTGVYRQKTVPVGSLPPNPWGLYEMHGNVWEWSCSRHRNPYDGAEQRCASKGGGGGRVLRGGSWYSEPGWLRSAVRFGYNPDFAGFDTGFRLARAF
uniref:Formylglycine-generating enzyme, required for sulfatase activity, contains SUMF1/FGE domain n=1 Tax=Candidatus Kentrum sp. DK TaxID=2126562 RepID=A0A450S5W8_9GAMM|nr:MAG: Formylglycine-generating enzyme, required for sulfatase activity, contains SUMF1/FGE domain [Candidatus Kentron sp. DK]